MPEETTRNKKKFSLKNPLKGFSVFDLVLLAMLTGLSIAFKTVVGILVRMITGPLGIPGGALAGGFYMLWLPLAIVITGHRGSALLIAAVQTIVMITTGAPGSHGVWTVVTYLLPAVLVELVFIYSPKNGYNVLHYMLATILANMAGTFGSNLLFFRLSLYPLLFALLASSLSGAVGGVIAYFVFKGVDKSGILKKNKSKKKAVPIDGSKDKGVIINDEGASLNINSNASIIDRDNEIPNETVSLTYDVDNSFNEEEYDKKDK